MIIAWTLHDETGQVAKGTRIIRTTSPGACDAYSEALAIADAIERALLAIQPTSLFAPPAPRRGP